MTTTTPRMSLHIGDQMFARTKTPSNLAYEERPQSQVTDNMYTDIEDDSTDTEDNSLKSSNQSVNDRRSSNTTASSYGGYPTPQSETEAQFELLFKPVEGPQGPHLFRDSQSSEEFVDFALQMSPLDAQEQLDRSGTAFSQNTVVRQSRPPSRMRSPLPVYIPGLPSNVHHWTPQDVADWMYNTGIESAIYERFENHDISGTVLVEMQFDDLKELGIESFGKRHQLWNAMGTLKGGQAGISPIPTPFQDITRPCTNARPRSTDREPFSGCSERPIDCDATPISAGGHKKRRGRRHRHQRDVVTPAESISIVAIEQILPRPHVCSKGNDCPKWRKQQRLYKRIQEENGWPVSPTDGGHILITGDPGNAATAPKILPNVRREPSSCEEEDTNRPTSEAVPSVVASSDLLGPGQLPEFALHQDMLEKLDRRDPQDNVKQFLDLQHVASPAGPMERPPSPTHDDYPQYEMFPNAFHQAYPPLQPPRQTPAPHENLKSLPKLSIPRASTASPNLVRNSIRSPISALSLSRSATISPRKTYRHGTPASEMDIPVNVRHSGPVSRDSSRSVPPNMHYYDPIALSRPATRTDWRRPSFAMPSLNEGEVFSPNGDEEEDDPSTARPSDTSSYPNKQSFSQYGTDCRHAGYMKKRKTKLLRHEWHDAHFRLNGSELNMHATNRLSSPSLDTINVDNYSITASSVGSNSKISAALKSLKIRSSSTPAFTSDPKQITKQSGGSGKRDAHAANSTSFAFHLTPESVKRDRFGNVESRKTVAGKTHHFAVKDPSERIDWMRELMVAKSLQEKRGLGWRVDVNGASRRVA